MSDGRATAYFITWSCYGQHLHGDEQGSVDRVNNVYGTPLPRPHRGLLMSDADQRTEEPFTLDADLRAVVDATIRQHADFRGWRVLALNVRTTHVHVVLRASGYSPEKIMGEFKAWSSRRMRESGLGCLASV